MNKNVTDSWKSEKLNACADSVDQALFSAPSKEPGYEATPSGITRFLVTARTKSVKSEVWPLFVLRMRGQFLRPFSRILLMKIYASCMCFCACSLGYWTLRRSCKRERQAEVLARDLATYVYATCNRKSRA